MKLDDFIRDRIWCLRKDQVIKFVNLTHKANAALYKPAYRNSRRLIVPVRSSLSQNVFYEVIVTLERSNAQVSKRVPEDVLINVCFNKEGSKGDMVRAATIYKNGVIIRWGGWILEVLELLPQMLGRLATQFEDFQAGELAKRGIVDEFDGRTAGSNYLEAERKLHQKVYDTYGVEIASDLFQRDFSGRPVDSF